MKEKFNLLIIFVGICSLSSCTSDSVSDLTEPDTQTAVTYTARVKSIMDTYCISCHGANQPSGNLALHTFATVRTAAANGSLLDRISRPGGSSGAMPVGGPRLSQNDINAISNWINANYPE